MENEKKPQVIPENIFSTDQLEGLSKIAAANAIAQTLSYSLERKYLQSSETEEDSLCALKRIGDINHSLNGYKWLKVIQVGKIDSNSPHKCFDMMQTILHSCHLPGSSLTFLIIGNKGVYSLYIGLSDYDKSHKRSVRSRISALQDFASSNWKGLVSNRADDDKELKDFFSTDRYTHCYAITGIPALNSQDIQGGSIDQIVGGCRNMDHVVYLVTAKSVSEENVDAILRDCRDIQSQAESFKGFSLSESFQQSENTTDSHSVAKTVTETISGEINNTCSGEKTKNIILAVTGLAVTTALLYPPALSIVPKVAGSISAIPRLSSSMKILNLGSQVQSLAMAKGLIPKKSIQKKDKSESEATTDSTTHGFSKSYTKSVSQNISNAHVEAAIEHIKKHAERFESGKATGMWEVGCYVLTKNEDNAVLASQVKAVVSGKESVYEPIRIHDVSDLVIDDNGYIKGFKEALQIYSQYIPKDDFVEEPFRHPFGKDFARLTTMLTTKELSCLINMPGISIPGINVADILPDFSLNPQLRGNDNKDLELGHLIYNLKESPLNVGVNLNTFSRHALVAGINGSGKTNTVLSVLDGFLRERKPVMVLEPAKTEYVDWALKYNEKAKKFNATVQDESQKKKLIKIFIPGCNYYAKGKSELKDILRINPFEVIPSKNEKNGYRVVSHLDKLKSVLAGAFPMQDILPTVIERLLYKLYDVKGWLNKENKIDNSVFPTLDDINLKFINDLMIQLGYAEENTLNISAALRTRFNSMRQGWKGEMLNNQKIEGITWEDLFENPCVINLSYVGNDSDKAFIMSLIMQFLYEYRIAESEAAEYSFNDNECRHLTVIEEAHRVMKECVNPEIPQYISNQMFASILSEVRAYGQGIMVVDQVPSRLIEDAVKNTNIKVIHKMVSADDTKLIAESVGLTPEQQNVIPKLSIGEAILIGLNCLEIGAYNSGDIYMAKINKKK